MSPRLKLFVAIGIGVLLAGPPVLAFNLWLNGLVRRQAAEELDRAARRQAALADARIVRSADALRELTRLGIRSCAPADIDALRQATFDATSIKELSVVAPDGRTLCTDVGNRPEARRILSSEPLPGNDALLLEIVMLDGRSDKWVRLRQKPVTTNSLAALIPASSFVPQISVEGGPMLYSAKIATAAGNIIADTDADHVDRDAQAQHRQRAERASDRFKLTASVGSTDDRASARQNELRSLGGMISGLLAAAILVITLLIPRRARDNPITEMERALAAGEFVPYFQPIVDIRSGKLRGAEVLVRWQKPDGVIVPPGSFIPLAESSGLIIELTRNLMRTVCKQAGGALGPRPHIKVAFNLTAQHFANEDVVEDVKTIFKRSRIRLSQVVLEVTERQPIENLTETRRVIAALQGIGVKVAMDDVGTGHSGLSYMLKLGVDIIKIDKMFIDSVGTDRHSNTIIETLIDLAQNMRMDVVAEGVESFEQVLQLREMGIRAAQGFVFSPPLPCDAFLKLIDAIDPLKGSASQMQDTVAVMAALAGDQAAQDRAA